MRAFLFPTQMKLRMRGGECGGHLWFVPLNTHGGIKSPHPPRDNTARARAWRRSCRGRGTTCIQDASTGARGGKLGQWECGTSLVCAFKCARGHRKSSPSQKQHGTCIAALVQRSWHDVYTGRNHWSSWRKTLAVQVELNLRMQAASAGLLEKRMLKLGTWRAARRIKHRGRRRSSPHNSRI